MCHPVLKMTLPTWQPCRCDATADDLIDVVEGNRSYIPCIYLLNKIDQAGTPTQ